MDPNEEIERIVDGIFRDYDKGREIDRMDFFGQPDQDVVIDIIRKLVMILYPGYYRDADYREGNAKNKLALLIEETMHDLGRQIEIVLSAEGNSSDTKSLRKEKAQEICCGFFGSIPEIRDKLDSDIEAAFKGDPAARDKMEIVLAYPGLYAITVYRLAHELYLLGVPYIPRIMTEYAHRETGVDIHPGAIIGRHFFIDHATGIVIGETAEIGENVKIYQGVTIGALSTKEGQALHGVKRHPTIEDNVTLYAGAVILGGETVIGHDSTIGGSSFVTKSVPPYAQVSVKLDTVVSTD